MNNTCKGIKDIETGDVLAWGKAYGGGGFWMNMVRLMTVSDYGHVSIAHVTQDGTLMHIEAVMPAIRHVKVPKDAEFYVIKASQLIDKAPNISFLLDKVGLKYSIMDAIRSYLGMVLEADDKWQCAELILEYFKSLGITLHPRRITPTCIIDTLLDDHDLLMFKVGKQDRLK